ncbi:S66 family peptidase [Citrobacter sp. Igbk 14]|uniref:S66 family peptidase n=1 Tax=Citrobacter sp. Igbk 14 TaxID=2963960 RepID=UPI0023028A99|nr:S66 peptidase family protein [Citrobacter sp. Igbk 14]MDA8514143.1 LD-carboxypeptidase [Citrobacter sp. Igbk 14]
MTTRYAAPIKPGDTIALFSPSSPATAFAPNRYARAKEFIQKQGYRIKEGALTGKSAGWRSGSIKARADEFNQLLHDPDVKCIMSTIGGNNTNAILPYIDYQQIITSPKIIIGYSDITALLLAIYQKTGLITFYGPAMVASFGEYPPLVDWTFDYFSTIVTGNPPLPLSLIPPSCWSEERLEWETQSRAKTLRPNTCQYYGEGKVTGRLIGGNLNTLYGIWGSEYMPEILAGDILLIEDSLKDISELEREYAHLALCGVFEKISAIILGKHECLNDLGCGQTQLEILREVLAGRNIPIVSDYDCSHTHPMMTLPLGVTAEIDFAAERIALVSPWLAA